MVLLNNLENPVDKIINLKYLEKVLSVLNPNDQSIRMLKPSPNRFAVTTINAEGYGDTLQEAFENWFKSFAQAIDDQLRREEKELSIHQKNIENLQKVHVPVE